MVSLSSRHTGLSLSPSLSCLSLGSESHRVRAQAAELSSAFWFWGTNDALVLDGGVLRLGAAPRKAASRPSAVRLATSHELPAPRFEKFRVGSLRVVLRWGRITRTFFARFSGVPDHAPSSNSDSAEVRVRNGRNLTRKWI